MRKLALGLFAALSGAAVLCSSAAIRVVDGVNGNNENDGTIVDQGGGVLVTNAVKTISRALEKVAVGDVVVILPGVYCEESVLTNRKNKVTLRGASGRPEDVILDGGGTHRILYSSAGSNTFENLTFQNGYRPNVGTAENARYAGDNEGGGAIRLNLQNGNWMSTISNCVFRNNETAYYDPVKVAGSGGGAVSTYPPLEIYDSVFSNNAAAAKGGGGGGGVHMTGNGTQLVPRVERCRFVGNSCSLQGCGGALVIQSANLEPAILRDCTFVGNHTFRGDVFSTGSPHDKSNVRATGGAVHGFFELVDGCTFVSNWTDTIVKPATNNAPGGALYLLSTASMTRPVRIQNCVFRGNYAQGACGALGSQITTASTEPKVPKTPYVISNCVFEANSSYGENSALGFVTGGSGVPRLDFVDCAVVSNRAVGGLVANVFNNDTSLPTVTIYAFTTHVARCTFKGNYAPYVCSALSVFNRGNNRNNYGGCIVEDCVFEGNVCGWEANSTKTYNSGCGALYMNDVSTNVIVRNCLFLRNEALCRLGGSLWASERAGDLYRIVENCTFVKNRSYCKDSNSYCLGSPYLKLQDAVIERCAIRNCIIAGNDGTNVTGEVSVRDVCDAVRPVSTNNLYSAFGTGAAKYTMADGENGCKVGYDPKFYDAAHGDCRIRRISPARDRGIEFPWMREAGAHDLLVTNEFGKVSSRIYGPTVDLGCYEWRPTDGLMLFVK